MTESKKGGGKSRGKNAEERRIRDRGKEVKKAEKKGEFYCTPTKNWSIFT